MENKLLFTWKDLLNSPLIRTEKSEWVGHAGKGQNGSFYGIISNKVRDFQRVYGPYQSLALACDSVESWITIRLGLAQEDTKIG